MTLILEIKSKKETFKNLQKYFNLNQQQIEKKINDFKKIKKNDIEDLTPFKFLKKKNKA